eukprot:jgi/Ulvmu1/4476/UM002_0201.1
MDRRAVKADREIAQCSLSSMAYLLSELVQYTVARSASHEEVISRLMNAGFEVGRRAVEIVSNRRDRTHMHMRPVTVLEVVRQVSSLLWPYLFGKQPDSLQRDDENEGTFYLIENTPKFTKYMSEPIRAQQVSSPLDTPGYFVAGIVKGYLVSSGFPADVDAAWKIQKVEPYRRSVVIIKFTKAALARERRFQR